MEPPYKNLGFRCAHTFEETAQHLGLTRQRVQQIEKSALLKLRRAFEARGITSVRQFEES